jgi:Fe-S cluster assembly ATP-binding protein
MLEIHNLKAGFGSTQILNGLNLTVAEGEVHALMGLNGSGKSTLAAVLTGNPSYSTNSGTATWKGKHLLGEPPETISMAGVFLAFQYPVAIPGVSVAEFLRLAKNSHEKAAGKQPTSLTPFLKELKQAMKLLELPWSFASRSLNDGFSGGEKKRLEMLQMLVLQPELIILDEIDSGLDVDAMQLVAEAFHFIKKNHPETTLIIITHYNRILELIKPDKVSIFHEGKIIQTGGAALAQTIEKTGYSHLKKSHAN